jgi:hypothetical protein
VCQTKNAVVQRRVWCQFRLIVCRCTHKHTPVYNEPIMNLYYIWSLHITWFFMSKWILYFIETQRWFSALQNGLTWSYQALPQLVLLHPRLLRGQLLHFSCVLLRRLHFTIRTCHLLVQKQVLPNRDFPMCFWKESFWTGHSKPNLEMPQYSDTLKT